MQYGIILTRAQPIHNGHIFTIQQALTKCDHVLLIIGSANKSGTKRNPFPLDIRKDLVTLALKDNNLTDRVTIMTLSDWSMEDAYPYAKEWGSFLYYNIVNSINRKSFTFYYNDNPAIVENWFPNHILQRICIKHTDRITDISSTQIREALLTNNTSYLKQVLPPSIYEIRSHLQILLQNCDKQDFIMT